MHMYERPPYPTLNIIGTAKSARCLSPQLIYILSTSHGSPTNAPSSSSSQHHLAPSRQPKRSPPGSLYYSTYMMCLVIVMVHYSSSVDDVRVHVWMVNKFSIMNIHLSLPHVKAVIKFVIITHNTSTRYTKSSSRRCAQSSLEWQRVTRFARVPTSNDTPQRYACALALGCVANCETCMLCNKVQITITYTYYMY